jgi:thiopurine S-methyltransferase
VPDKNFWEERYFNNETQWDLGTVSPPIKNYIDTLKDKSCKILIPGAGNGHEAEYIFKTGFHSVYVADIACPPLEALKKRLPEFPHSQLLLADFFNLSGRYDLILEQTFFCALNPSLRAKYAEKMAVLLNPGGRLVGVLFNDTLNSDHPPYGGNKGEYEKYFAPYFEFHKFEECYNSVKPRAGRELFINLVKK